MFLCTDETFPSLTAVAMNSCVSGIQRRVGCLKSTDVSEQYVISIFRAQKNKAKIWHETFSKAFS
jgi:hypothetical protein